VNILNTENQDSPGGRGLGHRKIRPDRKNIHLLDWNDLLDSWPDPGCPENSK
jgi:hypothetical protein